MSGSFAVLPAVRNPFRVVLRLFVFLRFRADSVGLAFWIFGAFAFLVPGLVHFGPIYEFESFRWQFAAGFGFAGALGVAAGLVAERLSPRLRIVFSAFLIAAVVGPWFPNHLPRVARVYEDHGRLRDLFWPREESRWILAQTSELADFSHPDYLAAKALRRHSGLRDRLVVNAPWQQRTDLRFESTLAGLSGVRTVGHSFPWPQEAVGTAPFHRSAPLQVFWEHPSEELLVQLGADWVYLRPDGELSVPRFRKWLTEHADSVWQHGDHALFRFTREGKVGAVEGVAKTSTPLIPKLGKLPQELQTAEYFEFEIESSDRLWAWAFLPVDSDMERLDLHEVVVGRGRTCGGVTPPTPGEYELRFFEVRDTMLRPSETSVRVRVTERTS